MFNYATDYCNLKQSRQNEKKLPYNIPYFYWLEPDAANGACQRANRSMEMCKCKWLWRYK